MVEEKKKGRDYFNHMEYKKVYACKNDKGFIILHGDWGDGDFLRQMHRIVRSNNVSLRKDIEPTRNSWIMK